MSTQHNTADSSFQPNDESDDQEGELEVTTTTTDPHLAPKIFLHKTARDQFFEDLQHEKDKNRWSAKCLLCKKVKRVFDKIGVTSNFTRHAREYHKEQYEQWSRGSKKVNCIKQIDKITTHFQKPKHSPIGQSYGSNHSRQVELSAAIVNDLIISLG
ncbi:unnamed protein product, partial [Adineta ricciae]